MVAAGLPLVSTLGGVVFAVAAVVDNLASGPPTEPATIVVHLVITLLRLRFWSWSSAARRNHEHPNWQRLSAPPPRQQGPWAGRLELTGTTAARDVRRSITVRAVGVSGRARQSDAAVCQIQAAGG